MDGDENTNFEKALVFGVVICFHPWLGHQMETFFEGLYN